MSRYYLNNDWKFTETYTDELSEKRLDLAKLSTVQIPHTAKELPAHYFDESSYQMVCGYRKVLYLPKEWSTQRLLLTFEGAAHQAWVYLNGREVGEHHCGYTAFTVDLTDAAVFGVDNILTVKLDSREDPQIPPFGYVVDYMTFSGLYRPVYLDVKESVYLKDVFVSAKRVGGRGDNWKLSTRNTIVCNEKPEGLKLRRWLISGGEEKELLERPVPSREDVNAFEQVKKGGCYHIRIDDPVASPRCWDIEDPFLYRLRTALYCGDRLLDEKTVSLGFREAEFRKNGFYLNKKKIKIMGLNRHQSYPYVGYAMPKSMQCLDADLLKRELGCNAVRTSHYPQSQDFIDRCDEIGLLVFTEMPGWQHIGDEQWKKQACRNLREMIRQYRNHPSIILWGVRINESEDDDAFYEETNRIAHKLDPTRQTGGVRAHKRSRLLEDVYTYNDFLHDGRSPGCEPKKNVTPDMEKPYMISEYGGHMYPSKPFDWEEHRREHAIRHARILDAVAGEKDICGSFGWCMFDYHTHKDFGSGDRICYHGVMDMFRNPKLAALVYSMQQEEEIILEISSSMDIGEHPASNRGETYIFTNADSVRMYKNDVFIHEYSQADSAFQNLAHGPILINDFIGGQMREEPGFTERQAELVTEAFNYVAVHGMSRLPLRLKMIGAWCMLRYHMTVKQVVGLYNQYVGDWGKTATEYRFEAIRDGEVVKTRIKAPAARPHLEAEISTDLLTERETYDVAMVRLRVCDENGNPLPYYNDPVTAIVQGQAKRIGPMVFSLEGGMGGLYVRSAGRAGSAVIMVGNDDLGYIQKKIEIKIHKSYIQM